MQYREYLFNRLGECILGISAAGLLSYFVLTGFNVSDSLSFGVELCIVNALVLMGALYAVSYRKKTRIIGYTLIAVVLLTILGISILSNQGINVLADEGQNLTLALLIVWASDVACFILSRNRFGCIALLVGGALLCCFVEVLYQEHRILLYAAFCLVCLSLIMVKFFSKSALTKGCQSLNFVPVALESVVFGLVALSLAAALFYVVIAPLNPPKIHPILTTEYVSVEEQYVRGVGNEVQIINPDLYSQLYTDETIASSLIDDSGDQDSDNMDDVQEGEDEDNPTASSSLNLDNEDGQTDVNGISLWQIVVPIVLVILVLLVLAALVSIGLKYIIRRHWLKNTLAMDAALIPSRIYARVRNNLAVLGYEISGGVTIREFACNHAEFSQAFAAKEGCMDFLTLTDLCERAYYGAYEPSSQHIAALAAFQKEFYRNARAYVGAKTYLWKWLFIR